MRLRRERARDIEGRGGRKRERERETDVSPIVPCACGCVPGTDDQLKNVQVQISNEHFKQWERESCSNPQGCRVEQDKNMED